MRKYNKKRSNIHLWWWILGILTVPIALILIISIIVRLGVCFFDFQFNILLFDLSAPLTISDYISLYAAFAGIGATLFLGFAIHSLGISREDQKEIEEIIHTKNYLSMEIRYNLEKIFNKLNNSLTTNGISLSYVDISETELNISKDWGDKLSKIKSSLSEDTHKILYDLFVEFDKLKSQHKIADFVSKYTVPFYTKHLPTYEALNNFSSKNVIIFELYRALEALDDNLDVKYRKCQYDDKKSFYEESTKNGELSYKVYNRSGNVIIDAVFHSDGTYSGFMTLFKDCKIKCVGDFIRSKQISGEIKNALCDENGKFISVRNRNIVKMISAEEYNRVKDSNKFVCCLADFTIIDGQHQRNSDITYVEYTLS